MEIMIIEGARGGGKSTVANRIRQNTPDTTLINLTGFKDDGESGLLRISTYYDSWLKFLNLMKDSDSNGLHQNSFFLFDRFFFSEQVFSQAYKNYDFSIDFHRLHKQLANLANHTGVDVKVVFLTISDKESMRERLENREKIPFANVEETVKNTFLQQELYREMFSSLEESQSPIKLFEVDTTNKTTDEVYRKVLKIKTT